MTKDSAPPKAAAYKRRSVHEKLVPGPTLPTSTALALELRRLDEVRELLWIPEGMSEDMAAARLVQALEFYQEIAPRDGTEGMLALQMVGTHSAALECLRRAAIPSQTFEGRDMALKHAHKLMTLYSQQLMVLDKHRGKGQQKMTVEHVHVHPGGQAIVGQIEAQPPAQPALEHTSEVPTDLDKARLRTLRTGK